MALVDREDIALAQRIIRFRLCETLIRPSFALLALTSRYFQNQLALRATGSTAHGIKASKLPQLLVVLPSPQEQEQIERYLADELRPIHNAINRTERELALIREYPTRLICDIVTGNLDVRSAARQLPAETADLETDLLNRLRAWKQASQFAKAEDWIFASPVQIGRLPYSYTGTRQELVRAAKAAGIPHVSTHSFRHTYRSWLASLGTGLDVQKQLMRHSTITMTMDGYGDVITDEASSA